MAHRHQFAPPVMRRAAGLHPDQARLDLGEKLEHPRSRELARHDAPVLALKSVNMKIVLGQIDPDPDKLLHGRSPSLWRSGDHALAL